ncbi:MAG: toxin-antitoxin system YwqK family antitoxin [Flavobacteriaceae bacterium]
MLKIKSLVFVLCFTASFFSSSNIIAQKINQFDQNKKRTGVWKKYYKNKRIRYVGKFKDGKEIGTFKYYDVRTSKYPTAVKTFKPQTDSAYVKFYTLNGKLRSKGWMVLRNRVGPWTYYFSNGKLFSEEFYTDGKLDGIVKNYYSNGKLLEETQYKNGMKNGLSKKYSDDGILIEEVTFKDNVLNGAAKYFELNGNLRERGIYRNGKRYGKWEFFMDGEIVDEKKKRELKKFKPIKKNNKN